MSLAQEERLAIIGEEIPKLITALTGFYSYERNFKRCEKFFWYTIKNHKGISVNSHEIKHKMDGMMEKFIIGNYKQYAAYLKKLYTEFINDPLCLTHYEVDVHWAILEFLLILSYNPVGSLKNNPLKIPSESSDSESEFNKKDVEYLITLLLEDCIPPDEEKSDLDSHLSDWSAFDDFGSSQISDSENNLDEARILPALKPPEAESNFKLFDGSTSEQILLGHTQNSWWMVEDYECKVNSLHGAANFCAYWQKYVSEKSNYLIKLQKISTVSEYCLLREIIWMFHFPADSKFFYVNSNEELAVRENVSIPSVTAECLQGHLECLIPYIRALNNLRRFIHSVYYYDGKPPPNTYQYYAPNLESLLQPFYKELLHQEEIIKEDAPFQIKTLIQFQYNMQESFKYLENIYDIHTSAILNFKTMEAHLCSTHLLAGLMFKFRSSTCLMTCNLAISLFLPSVTVFCNIIDNWWTEAWFDDWRDEFLVERIFTMAKHMHPWFYMKSRTIIASSKISNVIKNDAFLKLLMQHSLDADCTFGLLFQIKKIEEYKRTGTFEKKMYDIFIQAIFEDIDNFQGNTLPLSEEDEGMEMNTDQTDNKSSTSESMNSFLSHVMATTDDEFLLSAFNKNLNFEQDENDKICEENTLETNAFEIYKKLTSSEIVLPMEDIILNRMSKILQTRMSHANQFVMGMCRGELGILTHIKNMQRVLLLESNDLLEDFYRKLFTEIESGKDWANSFLLTVKLDDIMCSRYPDVSTLFYVNIGSTYKCKTLKVVDAIDELTIDYNLKKELQSTISQETLAEYNKVFRFLLKVEWSVWTVQNLPFALSHKNRSPYLGLRMIDYIMRQLEQIRSWLMYVLQNIHLYLTTHVLQFMGERLEENIQKCTTLSEMKFVHDSYIKTVSEHCFTNKTNGDIKRAIEQIFNLVYIFRVEWMSCIHEIDQSIANTSDSFCSYNYVETSQEREIRSTYLNCHNYLCKVLNHEVYVNQNFFLSGLASAISSCLPE